MKKIIATALALVMCLGIMSMVVFAAAPELSSLAIVGENIPGVGNWDPADPTGDMTKVSDGVYEKVLDCPAGTNMNFKIAGNDKWDDTCNFGSATLVLGQKADLECSGGSGNMNLTFDKATKIKITVDVNPMNDGGAATILVENVDDGPIPTTPTTTQPTTTQPTTTTPTTTQPTTTQPAKENRTLTVKAPASWTEVNVYTWDPELYGTFPGAAAKKDGSAYKAEIKNTVVNLVISSQAKADTTRNQTGNIALEKNGKDITITIAEDCSYKIEYAGTTPNKNGKPIGVIPANAPLSNYRVVGNAAWMGSWDAASDKGRMYDLGNGLYRVNFKDVPAGSYELKITKDGKWDNAYGDNGNNYAFTTHEKGDITVDFLLKNGVGTIEVYGPPIVSPGDISMLSVTVLLILASVTTVVLVVNKKKFI